MFITKGSPTPKRFPVEFGSLSYQYQSAFDPNVPPLTDRLTGPEPQREAGFAEIEVAGADGTSIPTIISLETASSQAVNTFLL